MGKYRRRSEMNSPVKIIAYLAASLLVLSVVVVSVSQAGAYHKYLMRGTVLESANGKIYLCVGTSDGAKAGQELTVLRFVNTGGLSPKGGPMFKREEVGTVKIIEIVDEHMANATIISGEAKVNDLVELKK
jgi:hypothetical protein